MSLTSDVHDIFNNDSPAYHDVAGVLDLHDDPLTSADIAAILNGAHEKARIAVVLLWMRERHLIVGNSRDGFKVPHRGRDADAKILAVIDQTLETFK
jgi:hypothetical protein